MSKSRARAPRVSLTDEIVRDVLQQAASGSFGGRTVDHWDAEANRLVLRAREQAVGFYYRRRDVTVRLGDAEVVQLWDARIRAEFVHEILHQGGTGREARHAVSVIERMRRQHPDSVTAMHEAAKILLIDHGGGPRRGWTWHEAKEAFLAKRLSSISERWGRQVVALLEDDAFKPLLNRPVRDLVFEDLEQVLSELSARRGGSAVKRIVGFVKEMLNWAAAMPRAKQSGLSAKDAWWNDLVAEFKESIRNHTPTVGELVRTIIIVEELSKKDANPVSPGTLGMLWATVLLAQRTGQYCLMTKKRLLAPNILDEFEHDYDFVEQVEEGSRPGGRRLEAGWRLFTWSAEEMKGRRNRSLPHVLPIHPAALEILLPFGSGSNFMFPSGRKEGPCTQSALNQLFRRLAGARSTGHTATKKRIETVDPPKEGFDLFAANGIRQWTPHDARRTMTGFLNHHRIGAASSAILAHRGNRESEKAERERMLPVTKLHYHHDQCVFLKAEGMTLWTKRILEQYAIEKKTWSPTMG